jgi:DNA-binding PadR family transcriptional regulator
MSVRYGLLALLEEQPMHGYQLRQAFETSTGATWPLNIGQVYTTLARLERDGLVAEVDTVGEENQRVFAISPAGRDELRAWFATPARHESPRRDELAIKLAMAVRTPEVDVLAVIQSQRNATVHALQEYTRVREHAGDDLSWLLVADSLIFAAEAEIRWLDHCETRLARAQSTVAPAPGSAPASTSASTSGPRRQPARSRGTR